MNNLDHVALPECYVLCDGSQITEGIWAGHTTPDLNKSKRFLRGGLVSDALKVEEDSLQEHSHASTVSDPGHSHGYGQWSWNGAEPDGASDVVFDPSHDDTSIGFKYWEHTEYVTSRISMAVTGVQGGRKGSETKPKNMNVVFVMKVC